MKAGKSRFNLQTLPAADFPRLAMPARALAQASRCRRRRCATLLLLVQFAMAQQDIRYYLNGMLLVLDGRAAASWSPPTATGWRYASARARRQAAATRK